MSTFGARLLTGSVLAAIGLITVKVVIAVLSGFVALMAFLFFTVLPLVLVAWLLMKVFRHFTKPSAPAFD